MAETGLKHILDRDLGSGLALLHQSGAEILGSESKNGVRVHVDWRLKLSIPGHLYWSRLPPGLARRTRDLIP